MPELYSQNYEYFGIFIVIVAVFMISFLLLIWVTTIYIAVAIFRNKPKTVIHNHINKDSSPRHDVPPLHRRLDDDA